jgi:class 3 adenylate cyclase
MSDVQDFIDAGLYDPDDPGAEAHLALLQFLADEMGASIPELVQAHEEQALVSMSAFRALRPAGERVTLREAAARAGCDVGFAARVWRAAGFPEPRPHERRFSAADVEMLQLFQRTRDFVGEERALQLVRTLGIAAAQVAEAEIALVRTTVEAPLVADGHLVDVARSYRTLVTELAPRLAAALDTLNRHHMEAIGRRYSGSSPSRANLVPLAVGFADLSDYTGISARLDPEELGTMLDRFEATTSDLIAAAGANVAKRIGDAVMFVTNAPGVACGLALDLVDAVTAAGLPKLRVGLAFGDVVVRQGDFHGPTVNLAARLVATADPGTVLTDTALHDRLSHARASYVFVPGGRLNLSGFDAPVTAYQLLRA